MPSTLAGAEPGQRAAVAVADHEHLAAASARKSRQAAMSLSAWSSGVARAWAMPAVRPAGSCSAVKPRSRRS